MFGILHTPDGPVGFHLNTVKPARVVPGNERHSWANKKLMRGQSTACTKCQCTKTITRDYETHFQEHGATFDTGQRPACTGAPAA